MKLTRLFAALLGLAVFSGGVWADTEPPPAPSRAAVEAVLDAAPKADPSRSKKTNVVLLADVKDHGQEEHDYPLWQKRWSLLLGGSAQSDAGQINLYGPPIDAPDISKGADEVTVTRAWSWPTDEQFDSADVIVAFCYLKWSPERIAQIRRYLHRGGGLVVVHPASWTMPEGTAGVAELLGIAGYRFYRHGPVDMEITEPKHPICVGLPERIHLVDETYWPPIPAIDPKAVKVLAVSREKVSEQSERTEPQPVLWICRCGEGRVFGCQPGHFTWTFDDPYFRILLLRGIAWAAKESPFRFDALVLRGARTRESIAK